MINQSWRAPAGVYLQTINLKLNIFTNASVKNFTVCASPFPIITGEIKASVACVAGERDPECWKASIYLLERKLHVSRFSLVGKKLEYLGLRSQYILFPVSTVLYKVQCDYDNNVLDFQMKMLKGVKTNERNKRLGAWTKDWFYGNIRDLQIKPKKKKVWIDHKVHIEPCHSSSLY